MGRVYEIATTEPARRYSLMTLADARAYLVEAAKRASRLSRTDPATYGGLTLIEQGVFVGTRRLSLHEASKRYPSRPVTPYCIWEL